MLNIGQEGVALWRGHQTAEAGTNAVAAIGLAERGDADAMFQDRLHLILGGLCRRYPVAGTD